MMRISIPKGAPGVGKISHEWGVAPPLAVGRQVESDFVKEGVGYVVTALR